MAKHLPAFAQFIDDLRTAFADAEGDAEAAMSGAKKHLEAFVMDDSIHAHSKSWPSTEGHKNLLLYEDTDYGFVINAVVRTLDRKRGIHDHAHAWTAYGLLDGEEELSRYRRLDDGAREGYAEIELEGVAHGRRGTVDLVPPYGIHSENGGANRSVAVIVRSERWVGKVLQGRYKPDANTHHVGEGPTQVPFDITEDAEVTT
jgi:predicted metal-dependent enzyme (double-stranded beta helix superfamily)